MHPESQTVSCLESSFLHHLVMCTNLIIKSPLGCQSHEFAAGVDGSEYSGCKGGRAELPTVILTYLQNELFVCPRCLNFFGGQLF